MTITEIESPRVDVVLVSASCGVLGGAVSGRLDARPVGVDELGPAAPDGLALGVGDDPAEAGALEPPVPEPPAPLPEPPAPLPDAPVPAEPPAEEPPAPAVEPLGVAGALGLAVDGGVLSPAGGVLPPPPGGTTEQLRLGELAVTQDESSIGTATEAWNAPAEFVAYEPRVAACGYSVTVTGSSVS